MTSFHSSNDCAHVIIDKPSDSPSNESPDKQSDAHPDKPSKITSYRQSDMPSANRNCDELKYSSTAELFIFPVMVLPIISIKFFYVKNLLSPLICAFQK